MCTLTCIAVDMQIMLFVQVISTHMYNRYLHFIQNPVIALMFVFLKQQASTSARSLLPPLVYKFLLISEECRAGMVMYRYSSVMTSWIKIPRPQIESILNRLFCLKLRGVCDVILQ